MKLNLQGVLDLIFVACLCLAFLLPLLILPIGTGEVDPRWSVPIGLTWVVSLLFIFLLGHWRKE
jgi:hypothetical protein